TEVLGSERRVGATLDRLTHPCHLLEGTGESYRLRGAKRRQGSGPKGRRRGTARPAADGWNGSSCPPPTGWGYAARAPPAAPRAPRTSLAPSLRKSASVYSRVPRSRPPARPYSRPS